MRVVARAARGWSPSGVGPLLADVGLDTIRQDPAPSAAVLHGLFFGRTAPHKTLRAHDRGAGARHRPRARPRPPLQRLRRARRRAAERPPRAGQLDPRAAPQPRAADRRDRRLPRHLLEGPAPRRCVARAPRRLGFRIAHGPSSRGEGAPAPGAHRAGGGGAQGRRRASARCRSAAAWCWAWPSSPSSRSSRWPAAAARTTRRPTSRSSPPTRRPPAAPSRSSSPRAATTRRARSPTRPTRPRRATTTRRG